MIDLNRISSHTLQSRPFAWAEIDRLYSSEDAAALAATYPLDGFKTVSGYGGEKNYEYEARSLIHMGASAPTAPEELSEAWASLARTLCSVTYRQAMSRLTGLDLLAVPLEVNVFHYGPGSSLGPHLDLPDKLATHVLYFNTEWDCADGGCLSILNSADPADLAKAVQPLVGNSAVLVRSEASWHAVTPVVRHSAVSRRSLTATFYQPGSSSSMWPEGDTTPLHRYG